MSGCESNRVTTAPERVPRGRLWLNGLPVLARWTPRASLFNLSTGKPDIANTWALFGTGVFRYD
jgi:hypothetical protein